MAVFNLCTYIVGCEFTKATIILRRFVNCWMVGLCPFNIGVAVTSYTEAMNTLFQTVKGDLLTSLQGCTTACLEMIRPVLSA